MGIVSSPQGVNIGFCGARNSTGLLKTMIAPFSLPLYCCRSSTFSTATPTTGPFTVPSVADDHPPVAMVRLIEVAASEGFALLLKNTLTVAGPRDQRLSMLHGS